ncbi:MAG: hypothetical protein C0524_15340 [Rhodobacter sp.]|nr:hypothetical protein [Rhodobacter sp.]
MGPVLGGALAAIGGFGLSQFNVFGLVGADDSEVIAQLVEKQDALSARQEAEAALVPELQQEIARLAAQIATLEAVPAPGPPDLSRLDDLEARLAVIEAVPVGGEASTAALAAKLADLERQLAALPSGGAGTAEVEAALARLAQVEAEAQARAAEAAAMAEAAAQARALEVLAAAVAAGSGFETELASVADQDLQAALTPHVAGVATLAQLQADFPEAARAALQLARGNDEQAGWAERIVDFLGAQTGARSLTPREGDSPDAILSRAEFALGEGRLADALAELATLDPAVSAPLEGWIASAKARMAVEAALAGAH